MVLTWRGVGFEPQVGHMGVVVMNSLPWNPGMVVGFPPLWVGTALVEDGAGFPPWCLVEWWESIPLQAIWIRVDGKWMEVSKSDVARRLLASMHR